MSVFEPLGNEQCVTLEEVRAAADRVAGVAWRTPLLAEVAGGLAGASRVRLKCENLQRGGAFKLRGAYNFIAGLEEEERSRGVITYSSGNHGRAVSLAARELGVAAVVVVPVDAPKVKVEGIMRQGAEVFYEGTTSVERKRRAEEIAAERRMVIVPPFDHREIIAGQGTVGMEIVEDWPVVQRVVVPVGGGSLSSQSFTSSATRRSWSPTSRAGVGSACRRCPRTSASRWCPTGCARSSPPRPRARTG